MALAALVAMLAALVACAALLRPAAAGAATATQAAPPLLDVAFGDDAAFNISVAGENWVGSAPIRAFAAGEWQKLTHTGTTRSSGSDVLGEFSCVNVSWVTGGGLVLHTSLKTYAGLDMSIFVQHVPGGATGTNASNPVLPGGLRVMDPGNYDPVVAFPALSGGQLEQLGFVTWQSRMINVELGVNVTQVRSLLSNERASAPLFSCCNVPCVAVPSLSWQSIVFRACESKKLPPFLRRAGASGRQRAADHGPRPSRSLHQRPRGAVRRRFQQPGGAGTRCFSAVFIKITIICQDWLGTHMRKSCSPRAFLQVAPMDNFKSAVHHVQQRGGGGGGAAAAVWETGISSEVTELPAGFEHRTMLVAGKGITATMDAWGTALRKAYGTNHSAVFDRNIEYLSYWTDNGAYYSVRKACVFAPVYTQKIFLPSQARDKQKET